MLILQMMFLLEGWKERSFAGTFLAVCPYYTTNAVSCKGSRLLGHFLLLLYIYFRYHLRYHNTPVGNNSEKKGHFPFKQIYVQTCT